MHACIKFKPSQLHKVCISVTVLVYHSTQCLHKYWPSRTVVDPATFYSWLNSLQDTTNQLNSDTSYLRICTIDKEPFTKTRDNEIYKHNHQFYTSIQIALCSCYKTVLAYNELVYIGYELAHKLS